MKRCFGPNEVCEADTGTGDESAERSNAGPKEFQLKRLVTTG